MFDVVSIYEGSKTHLSLATNHKAGKLRFSAVAWCSNPGVASGLFDL